MMTLSQDGTKLFSPWAKGDRALMQPSEDSHRGGGRVLSESDKRYIQSQINRYNHHTELSNQLTAALNHVKSAYAARQDSLWRIASCTDLFGDELDPNGSLTEEQWNRAIDFIEQFQGGQQA